MIHFWTFFASLASLHAEGVNFRKTFKNLRNFNIFEVAGTVFATISRPDSPPCRPPTSGHGLGSAFGNILIQNGCRKGPQMDPGGTQIGLENAPKSGLQKKSKKGPKQTPKYTRIEPKSCTERPPKHPGATHNFQIGGGFIDTFRLRVDTDFGTILLCEKTENAETSVGVESGSPGPRTDFNQNIQIGPWDTPGAPWRPLGPVRRPRAPKWSKKNIQNEQKMHPR